MENEFLELKRKFEEIRDKDKNLSLRNSHTGLGYTFETLLNKKEDNSYQPDYKGIEIKTKYAFSKYGVSLFTLTPKSNHNESAIKNIYENYSYYNNFKSFKGDVYCNCTSEIGTKFIFKTKIDYEEKKIILEILDSNLDLIDNSIYWTFKSIKNRLTTKLNYLALVKAYPYKKDNIVYYKYTSIDFYKLSSFENFLTLLEKGLIYITFNIDTFKTGNRKGQIHDHVTAFKIKNVAINTLFKEIII